MIRPDALLLAGTIVLSDGCTSDGPTRTVIGAKDDPVAIRRLAAESNLVQLDDLTGNIARDLVDTETLVLVDRDGRIWGVYNGRPPCDVQLCDRGCQEAGRRRVERVAGRHPTFAA